MTTWVVIILAILMAVIVLAAINYGSQKSAPLDRAYFEKKWEGLLKYASSPDAQQLAIIEADKLLDEALKRRHYRGNTMGERLVSAQSRLTDNNSVWNAHKLRNRLVHEQNVRLKHNEVDKALRGFKQALKDMGAL